MPNFVSDLNEAISGVCDLRDQATAEHGVKSELAQRIVTALIALYDARTEAQRVAREAPASYDEQRGYVRQNVPQM